MSYRVRRLGARQRPGRRRHRHDSRPARGFRKGRVARSVSWGLPELHDLRS